MEYKNLFFTVWDVGGQDKIQPLWSHFCLGTNGLIYTSLTATIETGLRMQRKVRQNVERGRDARCEDLESEVPMYLTNTHNGRGTEVTEMEFVVGLSGKVSCS